jgi:signal transduction histidine kinase
MVVQKKGEAPFRPRARLLLILGEELITNEVIAVVELVKNAYDADATRVEVRLDSITDVEKGRIVVEDNGVGMDLATILNVWLEPATGHRTSRKKRGERTAKFGRPMLGEKGVGRFAAHKLGDVVELITRAEGSDTEVHLVVDWRKFKEDKYLDEVSIHWEERSPRFFMDQRYGTRIIMREFGDRKPWDERMVHNLATKLKGLNSPFGKELEFEVNLIAPEFREILKELPDLKKIVEEPVYLLEGDIDEDGHFHYFYRYSYLPYGWLSRELQTDEDIRDADHFSGDEGLRKPDCGPFNVHFHVWDLDPQSLRDTIGSRFYGDFVKPHTGVRIYRDNFRVWPYGESDDDWLSLDSRRVNNPTLRISRNQVIGVVEISQERNENLRDKTDREGLIAGPTFDDFRQLVTNAVAVLERERRKDKNRVDQLREKKQPEDDVTRAIGGLREEVEKHRDTDKYGKQIDRVESTYRQRIKEVLDPFIVSAGLGIAYALPVHEIIRNVDDLQRLLRDAVEKSGENQEILQRVNQALTAVGQIEEMVRGVGQMIRRGRPTTMPLSAPVQDALDIMRLRLQKEHIQPTFHEDERIYIRGQRNLIGTAVLNLIDNSYYWLRHNKPEDRRLVIRVGRDAEGRPRILVMDNGPGIRDDPALLVEPFFTRKPDGSGLGLYIVDRVQKAHDGQLIFLNRNDEPDLLDGANVALTFPREKEEK